MELPGGPGSGAGVPQAQPCPLTPCSCRACKGMLLLWHSAFGCGVQSGMAGGAPAVTGAMELPNCTGDCIINEAGRPASLNAGRKEMSYAPR